jgi:hypothetical protein
MKTRMLISITGAIGLAGLLGCSNPRVETVAVLEPVMPANPRPTIEPETSWAPPSALNGQPRAIVRVVPMAPVPNKEFEGKVCQIGGPSCLEMDERPFETCLLSSQHCGEKLRESARRGESFGLTPPGPMP